jgi:hypothetical protein
MSWKLVVDRAHQALVKSISVVDTEFCQGHGSIPLKDLLAGNFPALPQ